MTLHPEKEKFLREEYLPLIMQLPEQTIPRWGKMNLQQMIEHVTGFFKLSSDRLKIPLVTPEEQLPRFLDFLWSEKPFRENTKAPASVLPDEPLPVRTAGIGEAITKLEKAVEEFFIYFKDDPSLKTIHPVFGPLDYAAWIQLHHKHVTHHLRQFGAD